MEYIAMLIFYMNFRKLLADIMNSYELYDNIMYSLTAHYC